MDKLREKLDLLEYRRYNPHPNKFIGFLKPYKVTFPKEYYRQMHRLLGLPTTDEALRTHPSVVAQNTNDIIYRRFHRYNGSTLQDLQSQNPRCAGGYRLHKHFQFLSDEAETMLYGFLSDAIETMKLYGDWDTFYSAYCITHKLPYQLRIFY
ncbi:MAG: P63C domain-containing protein [Janthinobacterium lividum]